MGESETNELLGYFKYEHLKSEAMKAVSKPFGDLANEMADKLGHLRTCQLNEGLKDLLRAKDCFVRASLKLPKDSFKLTSDGPKLTVDGGPKITVTMED